MNLKKTVKKFDFLLLTPCAVHTQFSCEMYQKNLGSLITLYYVFAAMTTRTNVDLNIT